MELFVVYVVMAIAWLKTLYIKDINTGSARMLTLFGVVEIGCLIYLATKIWCGGV